MIATVVALAFLCFFVFPTKWFLNLILQKLVALISKIFCTEPYISLTEQYLLHLILKWLGLLVIWTLAKVQCKADLTALSNNLKKKARWRHFILVRGALTHPTHLGCAHCASKTLQWPCCDMKRPLWGVNNEIAFHAAAALRPPSL